MSTLCSPPPVSNGSRGGGARGGDGGARRDAAWTARTSGRGVFSASAVVALPLQQQVCTRWVWTWGLYLWGPGRQLRGLARAREPRPRLTKSQRSLWAPEAQGAGEGWECGAEASRGSSEPRRPPMAPASPATRTEAQLAAFPEAAPARTVTEGICKVPVSNSGIAPGRF